jgi:uncharacterized BrkB/YihY/UPF0761 family membrane protein
MKQTLLTQLVQTYIDREVPFHSAALACYIVIALPAYLLFFLSLSSIFFDVASIQTWIMSFGMIDAIAIDRILAEVVSVSSWTTIGTIGIMLWTGSAIFYRIQHGLREMWRIKLHIGNGVRSLMAKKILAMIVTLICAMSVIGIFIGLQIIGVVMHTFDQALPEVQEFIPIAHVLQLLMLIVIVYILYITLGDARISFSLALLAAFFVAVCVWVLQVAVQAYISTIAIVTFYGLAGSVIVLLITIFLLSNIFYAGAISMYVLAERYNRWHITPRSYAQYELQPSLWKRYLAWKMK